MMTVEQFRERAALRRDLPSYCGYQIGVLESLIGQARAHLRRGNIGTAADVLDEAEKIAGLSWPRDRDTTS